MSLMRGLVGQLSLASCSPVVYRRHRRATIRRGFPTCPNSSKRLFGMGDHLISVAVKDDAGLPSVSATAKLKVVARAADLPAIADKLVIEPDVILLNALNGISSEAFEVFNRNAAKAITWSAVADKPWIKLDAASGSTPALVTVSLGDLSGLTGGTQLGHVTVTSIDGQKIVVRVQVQK